MEMQLDNNIYFMVMVGELLIYGIFLTLMQFIANFRVDNSFINYHFMGKDIYRYYLKHTIMPRIAYRSFMAILFVFEAISYPLVCLVPETVLEITLCKQISLRGLLTYLFYLAFFTFVDLFIYIFIRAAQFTVDIQDLNTTGKKEKMLMIIDKNTMIVPSVFNHLVLLFDMLTIHKTTVAGVKRYKYCINRINKVFLLIEGDKKANNFTHENEEYYSRVLIREVEGFYKYIKSVRNRKEGHNLIGEREFVNDDIMRLLQKFLDYSTEVEQYDALSYFFWVVFYIRNEYDMKLFNEYNTWPISYRKVSFVKTCERIFQSVPPNRILGYCKIILDYGEEELYQCVGQTIADRVVSGEISIKDLKEQIKSKEELDCIRVLVKKKIFNMLISNENQTGKIDYVNIKECFVQSEKFMHEICVGVLFYYIDRASNDNWRNFYASDQKEYLHKFWIDYSLKIYLNNKEYIKELAEGIYGSFDECHRISDENLNSIIALLSLNSYSINRLEAPAGFNAHNYCYFLYFRRYICEQPLQLREYRHVKSLFQFIEFSAQHEEVLDLLEHSDFYQITSSSRVSKAFESVYDEPKWQLGLMEIMMLSPEVQVLMDYSKVISIPGIMTVVSQYLLLLIVEMACSYEEFADVIRKGVLNCHMSIDQYIDQIDNCYKKIYDKNLSESQRNYMTAVLNNCYITTNPVARR